MIVVAALLVIGYFIAFMLGRNTAEFLYLRIRNERFWSICIYTLMLIIADLSMPRTYTLSLYIFVVIIITQVLSFIGGYVLGNWDSKKINHSVEKYCHVKSASGSGSGEKRNIEVDWNEIFGGDD